MKTAVTGATGHVGAALTRELLSRGHSVRAVVRQDTNALVGVDVQRIPADIRDPASLENAFRGAEVVFHAAARISISRGDAAAVAEANIEGTVNAIAACRRTGVRRFIYFSSIEALDPRPFDTPVDEMRPFVDGSAGSPYALTKAHAEAEVRRAAADGLETVILNPTAIIGPFDFKPSLLGRAVIALAQGKLPGLVDGGFDWVDVRDVASAAVTAAERALPGSRYIVGGRWASMTELAWLVSAAAGGRPPRLVFPYGLARAWAPVSAAYSRVARKEPLFTSYSLRVLRGNVLVSHARASRDLSYDPRSLADTVRDACRWFRENGRL